MGDIRVRSVTPVISTSAYTASRYAGPPQKLSGLLGKQGVTRLKHLQAFEVGTQKAALTLLLYSADPGALVDGGTPSLASLAATLIGKYNVATADYETVGGVSVADIPIDRIISGNPHTPPTSLGDVWLSIVVTGTPTFAAVNALRIAAGVEDA